MHFATVIFKKINKIVISFAEFSIYPTKPVKICSSLFEVFAAQFNIISKLSRHALHYYLGLSQIRTDCYNFVAQTPTQTASSINKE